MRVPGKSRGWGSLGKQAKGLKHVLPKYRKQSTGKPCFPRARRPGQGSNQTTRTDKVRRLGGRRRKAIAPRRRAPEPKSHSNGGYLVKVAYLLVTTAWLVGAQTPQATQDKDAVKQAAPAAAVAPVT